MKPTLIVALLLVGCVFLVRSTYAEPRLIVDIEVNASFVTYEQVYHHLIGRARQNPCVQRMEAEGKLVQLKTSIILRGGFFAAKAFVDNCTNDPE